MATFLSLLPVLIMHVRSLQGISHLPAVKGNAWDLLLKTPAVHQPWKQPNDSVKGKWLSNHLLPTVSLMPNLIFWIHALRHWEGIKWEPLVLAFIRSDTIVSIMGALCSSNLHHVVWVLMSNKRLLCISWGVSQISEMGRPKEGMLLRKEFWNTYLGKGKPKTKSFLNRITPVLLSCNSLKSLVAHCFKTRIRPWYFEDIHYYRGQSSHPGTLDIIICPVIATREKHSSFPIWDSEKDFLHTKWSLWRKYRL